MKIDHLYAYSEFLNDECVILIENIDDGIIHAKVIYSKTYNIKDAPFTFFDGDIKSCEIGHKDNHPEYFL